MPFKNKIANIYYLPIHVPDNNELTLYNNTV